MTLTEIEIQAAKPLIYGPRSIRAWQQDAKGQTRRLANPQPEQDWWKPWQDGQGHWWWHDPQGYVGLRLIPMRQPYAVGDLLWIREALRRFREPLDMGDRSLVVYEVDGNFAPLDGSERDWPKTWKRDKLPGMFMPRWACRYYARIVSRRPERLQDISVEDAVAEGTLVARAGLLSAPAISYDRMARALYLWWWDSLHKKPGTRSEDNPWVWVYGLKDETANDRNE